MLALSHTTNWSFQLQTDRDVHIASLGFPLASLYLADTKRGGGSREVQVLP